MSMYKHCFRWDQQLYSIVFNPRSTIAFSPTTQQPCSNGKSVGENQIDQLSHLCEQTGGNSSTVNSRQSLEKRLQELLRLSNRFVTIVFTAFTDGEHRQDKSLPPTTLQTVHVSPMSMSHTWVNKLLLRVSFISYIFIVWLWSWYASSTAQLYSEMWFPYRLMCNSHMRHGYNIIHTKKRGFSYENHSFLCFFFLFHVSNNFACVQNTTYYPTQLSHFIMVFILFIVTSILVIFDVHIVSPQPLPEPFWLPSVQNIPVQDPHLVVHVTHSPVSVHCFLSINY